MIWVRLFQDDGQEFLGRPESVVVFVAVVVFVSVLVFVFEVADGFVSFVNISSERMGSVRAFRIASDVKDSLAL